MDRPEMTADQLEQGIHDALDAKDVRAAVDFLTALAAVDLDRAIAMYEKLTLAVNVAQMLHGLPG